MNFIGKIENFSEDLGVALNQINPDYKRFMSSERRHATNANKLLSDYYTPALTKLVQQTYEIDFNHFGYYFDFDKT